MRRYVIQLLLLAASCVQVQAAEVSVPRDLEDWRGWVLHGEEYRRCPFLASAAPTERGSYRCAWPQSLTLALDARGGTFAQRWQVFAESWVRVPGNIEHWPQDVRLNDAPAAIVARDGYPSLLLEPGTYAISGKLSWETRPESLALDPRTAIVDLTLDGRHIAQPERPDGDVSLGKRRSAEQPARMEVQVYRLLQDEVPARLLTRMRLQVAGDGREELLARVLPDGFTPLALRSTLPARLEPDGRMRVQVRAGSWDIDLEARGTGAATRLTRPPAGEGLWPREEVWSFAGDDRLRVAAAQGAEGIDPQQANVPQEWRGYPAFRMTQDAALEISERSRGLQNADDNRLRLYRRLWLDFDHGGLTAVDTLMGTMRKDWRLEMAGPYALESASVMEDPLLITRNPDGKGAGLEVRSPELSLQAVARTNESRGRMPATGWNTRFDQVRGELNLPPGHRLLAALGADRAPGAWVEQWGLWGLFGVLVVAVCAGWLAGRIVGAVAFVALLLTYQESPAYIWLWGNLLVALALARAAPDGRLQRFARVYRAVSLAILGIALLPLLWGQARLALHPQLEVSEPHDLALAVRMLPLPEAAPAEDRLAIEPPPSAAPGPPVPPAAVPPAADAAAPEMAAPAMAIEERPRENAAPMNVPNSPSSKLPRATVENPYGLNVTQVIQRYAPGTLVQTGPGIPSWTYIRYGYEWSGPVDPEQSVRFVFIGPVLLGIWRFVGIGLLAALFAALFVTSDRGRGQWWRERFAGATSVAPVLIASLLGAVMFAPTPSSAATPDSELLQELQSRLTHSPDCTPSCAEVTGAQVTVRGDRLDVALQVSALANIAVPVPSAGDRWQLDTITLDGRSAIAVGRESEGTLAVALTPGAHTVRLGGRLPAAASIQLDFPSAPRSIEVSSDGWDVAGLNEGRLLSGSLELIRRQSATATATALETSAEFPAFVRVTRTFDLGLDWSVTTEVSRVAPEKAAVTVEVPLLAGESALSGTLRTRDLPDGRRLALVGLERGQDSVSWSSGLARSDALELEVPADAARTEVWSFVVSPQWNVAFEGMPAVLPESVNASMWMFEFHPRPGEKLRARISRPERAEGATFAVDSVQHSVMVGKRSATTNLELHYRSTQGGRHAITLPKNARVTEVQLDGHAAQVRPDNGALSLGLLPGNHTVRVTWETPVGASLLTRPDVTDLHATAGNVSTTVSLPEDRWPLFAWGRGVGPAVLYWSELVVFAITAVLLGRWRRSPLRTHEWLLLGLGLSTLSWIVLVLVVGWLFALAWRQRWSADTVRWRFNAVQVTLAAFTVVALVALLIGVRQGLLASPDMGITGPGSYFTTFSWFLDRSEAALPRPTVFSVPMWVYRALMFAWALWLALALVRWLRWAWQAWKTNGFWRGDDQAVTT
jgi:hypothetical protein